MNPPEEKETKDVEKLNFFNKLTRLLKLPYGFENDLTFLGKGITSVIRINVQFYNLCLQYFAYFLQVSVLLSHHLQGADTKIY
jgi:hypothetical protein